jgi:hypothetical protein
VARRLRDPEWEVVLLTGAGMSFASSLEQAGMPWNDQLLTEAARSTLEELTNGGPIKPPSPARMDCSIRKMLVQYSEKKRVCLKDLFDDERQFNSLFVDQPGDWDKKFRKNFQRAVMRYDEGFCYQHWLAAKLNFAFIVSTNFDGFHERAATHHAATLGTSWSVDVLRNKKIAKPYGTTFKRDEIAFSAVEFQNAVAEMDLSDYFSKKKDKQLEIVAVGHALRDQEIPLALSNMAGTRLAKLTWVVPEAQAELHGRGVDEYSRVRLFKTPRRKDIATAIPVRAIDFFYDLWEADRLLEKERRP